MADKIDPKDCPHENFDATVAVGRFLDTGRFMADISVHCTDCGEPFRFMGVPAGLDWERPMVSIDGLELHAPIEPEIATRLAERATFQMPLIPTKH
jgi:hypothetical protein